MPMNEEEQADDGSTPQSNPAPSLPACSLLVVEP